MHLTVVVAYNTLSDEARFLHECLVGTPLSPFMHTFITQFLFLFFPAQKKRAPTLSYTNLCSCSKLQIKATENHILLSGIPRCLVRLKSSLFVMASP